LSRRHSIDKKKEERRKEERPDHRTTRERKEREDGPRRRGSEGVLDLEVRIWNFLHERGRRSSSAQNGGRDQEGDGNTERQRDRTKERWQERWRRDDVGSSSLITCHAASAAPVASGKQTGGAVQPLGIRNRTGVSDGWSFTEPASQEDLESQSCRVQTLDRPTQSKSTRIAGGHL
jgi:hypothetical protein